MISRKLLKFLPFFLVFLISSCSWFNNSSDENEYTLTICGTLTSQGALPELLAERTASRTATVSAPSGSITYTVELLASETATTALTSATATTSGTSIYYEMKYTPPVNSTQTAYFLRANAKIGDTLILQSAVTPVTCNFTNQAFTQDLELRPTGTGDSTATGTVLLPVTLETPGNFTSVSISDTNFTLDQTSLSSGTVIIKNNGSSIGAQAYPVTVSFYKSTTLSDTTTANVLVYQFTDVINIFNGLETNTWVDNGNCPHLTTTTTGGVTTTQCKITDALLESFKSTNFYVDNTNSSNGKGTFYEPFNSLGYAITYINSVGNDTDTYTVHVKANASSTSSENFSGTQIINKNITIECYKTLPGAKDGRYTLNHSDNSIAFSVYPGKTLTFESNGCLNSVYTDGIQLALGSLSHGVSIAQGDGTTPVGRFVMKGGGISGGSRGVRACGIFEMYGGGISACSTGVLLDYASSEMIVSGTPYIYNNTSYDVKIARSDINIRVTGPLTDGTRNALIGIYKTGTPTMTAPVVFTSGYGYQTGGYNAGVKPGRYFRGRNYGVTYDGDNTTPSATYGEAVLALSGGKINVNPVNDDITVELDRSAFLTTETTKRITFTVTKDKGITDKETDITAAKDASNNSLISYSYKLKNHGEDVDSSFYPPVTANPNKITLSNSLPGASYILSVSIAYGGKTYTSSFDVKIVNPNSSAASIPSPLPSGTDGTGGTTVTYVYFGSWPQTVKAEDVTVYESASKTQGGFTYYLGSDGEWYARCTETRYSSSPTTYSDGQTIGTGQKYFKVEPIKWRVLTTNFDEDGNSSTPGKVLLLADSVLHSGMPFYGSTDTRTVVSTSSTIYANNYEYSNIRAWLNGIKNPSILGGTANQYNIDYTGNGFLQKAFTAAEQEKIAITYVDNNAATTTDALGNLAQATTYASTHKTADKVFLLSRQDVTKSAYGFGTYDQTGADSKRIHKSTDWALANNAYQSTVADQGGLFWLRSPASNDSTYVQNVYSDGSSNTISRSYCYYQNGGVVPAICIGAL